MAPLLQYQDCSILLIDVVRRNIERANLDDVSRKDLIDRHALLQRAAQVVEAPKFYVVDGASVSDRDWITRPGDSSKGRVHFVESAGSLWFKSGLGAALAGEGSACLVVCGFWLERSVTFASLHALADGFDVFVLMDTCPCLDQRSHCAAVSRLVQAGVVPLTTKQLVGEWAEAATDEERRTSLLKLLPS